jgi:hypothetical protein
MSIELCAGNYATSYGLVNGVDDILITSTTYWDKNHYMDNVSKKLN